MRLFPEDKRAQVNNSVGAIVALVIGVGIGVLVLMFVGSLGGQTYNLVEPDILTIANNQVTGESFAPLANTSVALANHDIQQGTLRIYNTSTLTEVGTGNFTIDYTEGTLNLQNQLYNNSGLAANYTSGRAEVRGSIQSGVLSGFNALENTSGYLPIIVLAVVIALVLGMVLTLPLLTGRNGGGGSL